ncbi:hypothetical protein CR513_61707, partial [Mucuna pruriens]
MRSDMELLQQQSLEVLIVEITTKISSYQIGVVVGDTFLLSSPKCMTRSRSSSCLHSLDPEIDKTLNRLRKTKNIHVSNSSSGFNSIFESDPDIADNPLYEPELMENNNRTLKELATPDFHGLASEDLHKHLKEFHMVCSTMRPQGILEDYIKMKVFTFSLDGATKDWLYLQPVMFNTWGDMKCMFLEKFYPTSKTTTIWKEICGIRQHFGETLHKYWERFNKLYAMCLHHQISE